MGIKVDIGSADSQGSTANTVLSSRANYYDAVITAFNKLISEEELKGKAYDSAKSYAENIMVPLVRGVILFSESLGGKASELPTLYHAQVGEESLDEETLQKQIEAENTTISTQEAILNSLSDLKNIDSTYKSNVQEIISNATSKRDELQKKLDKLQSFASSTSGQFSDSESLQSLVFQGFEQVTGDFGKFDGTFKIEGQAPWANNINSEWKKRSEVIQNYQNVVDKVKNETELDENDIKAIAEYGKRYPGKELPENVKDAIQGFVDRTEAELLTMAQDVAKEQGISVEKAIDFILQQDESADKSSKFSNIVGRAILAKAEINFINGRQITSDSRGRVKIGSRFLYNKNTGHVYTSGSGEYSQNTGRDFDPTDTNIGKGVQTTGWQTAIGDAIDSAKSGFKNSLKFWDDFNWKDASQLSKWGQAGKAFGAIGTVLNVGRNIKENFWDDKTSSVGEKIRNFAVDQGVDLLSGASAASAGAAIGTFIGGPIGTVVGLGLGAAIGWLMNDFKIKELNNQSVTDAAKDALIKTTDAIGDGLKTIGRWFS
ncbi:T7SS effector LXG polymorphic toxin [Streptococcus sp.]|uniref:T7SS effector LXG polymorphic toxin n=1 Tax=Streptococcus sp. TaxID=1306 RepID=UPI0026DC6C85|nr:T7SS effector LXG polymorphic toxin [Streptococcus sp.]MDO4660206.1 T7SS effector LXG polymorphic toxin [Streptococcus sp.]